MLKANRAVILSTVLMDLVGFGMVIPLISVYGRHFNASTTELAVLGGIYSICQFFFAPFWGSLSDRVGRRPVLLVSLMGSVISYLLFAFADSALLLIVSRAFGGIFAANISTAQAYMADVTPPEKRAASMGLIGAAFGVGFTLGPPLGGIASHSLGLAAPGLIAASVCFLNWILAVFRLGESLPPEKRRKSIEAKDLLPLSLEEWKFSAKHPYRILLFGVFFLTTFAFSNIEQTFSLLFQTKFGFETSVASFKTGLVLMVSGLAGALVQGGLVRKLVPKFGEFKLILVGLLGAACVFWFFPVLPEYSHYFGIVLPLAVSMGFINPSVYGLISKTADSARQGSSFGLTQGLGSLARALGPAVGLSLFAMEYRLPFRFASLIYLGLGGVLWISKARFSNSLDQKTNVKA